MIAEPVVDSTLEISRLGMVPYRDAWDLQVRLGQQRARGEIPDQLLLLEHPHIYTLGRRGDPANILLTPNELTALNAEVINTDRGGDVTYHGPGQLVGYPILLIEDRSNLVGYVRRLESLLIAVLADFGIAGQRIAGLSGVWVREEKIAAIGVKMGRVTSHGFALNADPDMSYFNHIVPCGIREKGVTSMARLMEKPPSMIEVMGSVERHFGIVRPAMVVYSTNKKSGHADPETMATTTKRS